MPTSLFDFIKKSGVGSLPTLDPSQIAGEINDRNKSGDSALILAIRFGDIEAVRFLLQNGADVNLPDSKGCTPLITAITYENLEIANLIATFKPSVNLRNYNGVSALMEAAGWNMQGEVLQYLIENGAKLDLEDELGNTAFMIALENNNLEFAELLLNLGADINYQDNVGNTALMQAVIADKKDVVKFLLEKGAKTFYYNISRFQAADLARERLEIMELIDAYPENGKQPEGGETSYSLVSFVAEDGSVMEYAGYVKTGTAICHGKGVLYNIKEGRISVKGNYIDHSLNGFCIHYYLKDKVRTEGNFKHGIEDGYFELTTKDGRRIALDYVNGNPQRALDFPNPRTSKPARKIVLIRDKESDLKDLTSQIIFNYQIAANSIFQINDAAEFDETNFEQYVCEDKHKHKQIVFNISSDGNEDGSLASIKLIKEVLEKFLQGIIAYDAANIYGIARVKFNLDSCFGDSCVTGELYPIIQKFVENDIEVRTSAILGQKAISLITNGKNPAGYDEKGTAIVERLYTKEKYAAKQWFDKKSEKYQYPSIELKPTGEVSCSSGFKVFPSVKDLLEGNYVRPKTAVKDAAHQEMEAILERLLER